MGKRAEPLLYSIRSILRNPPFISYRPDKQKEIEKLRFIEYMHKWDDPVIRIYVDSVGVEWVVENILYPLRLRYGCFYNLKIDHAWKELIYSTTIKDVPIKINLCYATDCEWKKTDKKKSFSFDTYEMVCNGELAA